MTNTIEAKCIVEYMGGELRCQNTLTQNEVADAVDIDVRTVLNIENYKGNPKMEVLYPLIRALRIDAREIFNPEMRRETPALRQLRLLIEECSEDEAAAIMRPQKILCNRRSSTV